MGIFDRLFGEKNSIDRVVGGDKKQQRSLHRDMERRFRDQKRFDGLKKFEREKNEMELEAIRVANEALDVLREKYGLPSYKVPEENIHILRDSQKNKVLHGPGEFKPGQQATAIIESKTRSGTLHSIFHEMGHFKSYTSLETKEDDFQARRVGLYVRTKEGESAFNPLNEAVMEELTLRFMREMRHSDFLSQETEQLEEVHRKFPHIPLDDAFAVEYDRSNNGASGFTLAHYGYKEERKALHVLIQKLQERNPEVFRDKEEWFDLFASAMFNGHLLELARNLEKTFGQGTFRKIGEQKTGKEFLSFVESL